MAQDPPSEVKQMKKTYTYEIPTKVREEKIRYAKCGKIIGTWTKIEEVEEVEFSEEQMKIIFGVS